MSDDQELKIEDQERDEILEEIDALVVTNRLPVSEEMAKLTPQKSGIGFPLVINIFAVAAVLSTFYFSNRLFEQKQETLSIQNATYQSAEGRLLEELKKESAAKLEKKEQEIGAIQNELAELDRQSRELVESMDEQIGIREAEMRAALEVELENERQKLRAQGKSEATIETELQKIEEQRSAEYEADLAAFRAETEQAIAAKEEELATAKQLNEELLAEVNLEKERIQSETKARESELTAQYESEKAALAEEAATAEARLAQLSANQAKESLIIDQINGSYETIFSLIDGGNSAEALLKIESLKQLIESPAVAQLKSVSRRSGNDKNMLALLRRRIEEEAYKEDADTKSLAAAADLLLSTQEIAGLGTAAYNSGNIAEAEQYYMRSLQKIPSIRQAWENLQKIAVNNENARLTALLRQAGELSTLGDQTAANAQYAEAAAAASTGNQELLNRAVTGMLNTSDALRAAETVEKESALSSVKQLQQQLEETRQNYTAQLSAVKAEYEQKLIETENSYNAKFAEAGTELSSLEAEKNTEVDRLTRLIGERDQENLRINSEKEEVKDALSAAEADIVSKTDEIEALKSRYEAEKASLLAEAEEEARRLSELINAADQKYEELQATAAAGMEVAANRLKAVEITGYNNGVKQGRFEALGDILDFTSFIDGTSVLSPDDEQRITRMTESEERFKEAVQKIQQIAAAETTDGGADLISVKQDILIGSISYASGNQITIEPLSDIALESGTRITIKRKERGKAETYITFGIITSASEDKISARTDPAGTEQARSMDLVYITY